MSGRTPRLDFSDTDRNNVIKIDYIEREAIMRKTSSISLRMPEELAARLDNLAKATDCSRSSLATLAIEEFVALQEWQVEAIKEGIADAEQGRILPHEKAISELETWGGK